MRTRRWRLALPTLALALGLGLGTGFWWRSGDASKRVAEAEAPPQSELQPPNLSGTTNPAPTASSASLPERAIDATERRWQARDAAWCEKTRALLPLIQTKGIEALETHAPAQHLAAEYEAVWPELWRSWELRLRARPDPESQAMAEMMWLQERKTQDVQAALAGLERLRRLAEVSRSPWILGLATQASCDRGDSSCLTLARLWAEAEPHNLAALLLPLPRGDSSPEALATYMRRLLAARHHADPTEELMRRLWRMEPLDRPGLRRAVIPTMLMGTWAASLFRFPSQLRRHCKELLATGHSTELCLAVAEKYWQVGNRHIVDEVLIFGLAKHSQPLPSHWTDRVQASEARRQWLQEHPPVGPQPELAEISCAQNSELRDWVAAVFHQGEIAAAQARMPTEPQELKALSQRYRQQNRRGMLDSDPAPQTQSASR